ncbi:hypothetical protein LBMAG42_34660 [Deltaproteobacteria bacterium]|nr:hypothetical protein LBMAG42_34660 [Deltaproteobacteria bacterium]
MPSFDADSAEYAPIPAEEGWRHRRPGPPPRAPRHRAEAPKEPTITSTFSVSTLYAYSPMVSLTGELRMAPQMGFAFTGALGSNRAGDPTWDLGAGLDGYVIGNFARGVSIGAVLGASDLGVDPAIGSALTLTPRLGLKYTFDVPITVEVYGGVAIQPAEVALVVAPSLRAGLGFSF